VTLPAIIGVCIGSIVLAVLAFRAHVRWAGSGERAGLTSMLAFVFGWLCVITAVFTGSFLLLIRH
jgi:hypothetical protein